MRLLLSAGALFFRHMHLSLINRKFEFVMVLFS